MNSPADRPTLLSLLWIFVFLNFIYADFFILIFEPGHYDAVVAATTEGAVLGFAVLMEVQIAMVLLSRILPRRASRWANVVVGTLAALWVASTLRGSPPSFYVLFACVEIAAALFIVGYAWTWRDLEGAGR